MPKKPRVTKYDGKNASQFDEKIKRVNAIVLFHHPSCIHCIMLRPKWEMMKKQLNNDGEIMEVEVGALEQSTSPIRHEIQGYPSIVHVKDGKIAHHFKEERNIENMIKFINHHLNNRTNDLDFNYKIVKNKTSNIIKKVNKTKGRKNRKSRKTRKTRKN